jgi:hypothetical protein
VVEYAFNSRTLETKAEDSEFQVNLSYVVIPCIKKREFKQHTPKQVMPQRKQ